MNGPHGYFIRGPTIERLLELSIEDIIYNLVDADDCSVCKYENGKMIENWHVLKRRKKADCCSNCCVKTCVCIPKRKKYDASVWLMEHWYLHVIMISLLVAYRKKQTPVNWLQFYKIPDSPEIVPVHQSSRYPQNVFSFYETE